MIWEVHTEGIYWIEAASEEEALASCPDDGYCVDLVNTSAERVM